jgi:hypothetical protein
MSTHAADTTGDGFSPEIVEFTLERIPVVGDVHLVRITMVKATWASKSVVFLNTYLATQELGSSVGTTALLDGTETVDSAP